MDNATQSFLTHLARENFRGVGTDQLVYALQDYRDQAESPQCFGAQTEEELEGFMFFTQQRIKHIVAEIERRREMVGRGVQSTNREIIQAIKNAIDISTVLSWYTDVFTYKKQWTFRCTLHGQDKNPSGVIYKDQGLFHCFACNRHGDVFAVVMEFERVDFITALKSLARYVGVDLKPLVRNAKYQDITA